MHTSYALPVGVRVLQHCTMYSGRCEHQRILGMVQLREPIVIVPSQESPRPDQATTCLAIVLSRP